MELKSLKDIPTTFVFIQRAFVFVAIISILSIVGSVATSIYISQKSMRTIFAIDNSGEAHHLKIVESADERLKLRKIEAINHVKQFHKLFYQIDQFNYEKRIDEALYLIGNTGKDLYLTLKSKKHFSTIVANNLSHTIEVDSIKVNTQVYPYQGTFYGNIYVKRVDVKGYIKPQVNHIKSVFSLSEVDRNLNNPHGLLIENYIVKIN